MCRRGIAARAVLMARRIRRIQAEIRRGLYRVAIVAPLLSLLDRQRKQAVLLRRRAHRFTKTIEGASSAASCPIHATSRPSFVTSASMRRVALFDIDSRIPNLALMKLSAYYKTRGCEDDAAPPSIDPVLSGILADSRRTGSPSRRFLRYGF